MMADSEAQQRKRFLTRLLVKALDAYQRQESDLGQLVHDVESVIDSLFEVADADWVEELGSTWSRLEIIYALALDEGRSDMTDDEASDIDETIVALRSLIAAR